MRQKVKGFKPFRVSRRRSQQAGLTLAELVIASALIGLVGLSFAFLYSSASRQMFQSLDIASSQSEATFALEHIRRNLLRANAINVPAEGAAGGVLNFTFEPGGGGGEVNITYILAGTNLQANGVNIARNITAINFNRFGRTAVEITVTATQGGRATNLQTTVSARGVF